MAEPVVTEQKEEDKVKPLGIEVREKSFQQLIREEQEARNKPADDQPLEPTEDEKKVLEEKKNKEVEDAKVKADADIKAQQDQQEAIAKKAAEDVLKRQDDEKQKEQDRIKAEEDEKKRQESLKPSWQTDPNASKDKDGKPIPQSYDQIAVEAARIAEEKAYARLKAEQDKRDSDVKTDQENKQKQEQQTKEQQQALSDQLQKELDSDLTDLYTADKLPKIKDPKNENDPGIREQRNLFETAQRVNAERIAAGKPVIRSLKLIYYEHYKPLAKPAGHDAPVLGAIANQSEELPEDQYVPFRDRGKSIAQLVKEETAKLAKKVMIRGK